MQYEARSSLNGEAVLCICLVIQAKQCEKRVQGSQWWLEFVMCV